MVSANCRTPRQFLGCNLKTDGRRFHHSNQNLETRTRRCSPLLQEGAAGIFDVLQLQEAGTNQQSLNILLINGNMAAVGEVDQSLQGAETHQLYVRLGAELEQTGGRIGADWGQNGDRLGATLE